MRHHAAGDAGVERGHAHGKHLGAEGVDAAHLRGTVLCAACRQGRGARADKGACAGARPERHPRQLHCARPGVYQDPEPLLRQDSDASPNSQQLLISSYFFISVFS